MLIRDFPSLTVLQAGAPVTALSATGNSDPIDLGNYVEAIVFLNSTAHTGTTPTLDCKIQYGVQKADGTYSWVDSGDAFTQLTTVDGLFFKKLTANFGRWVRLAFTLGGTLPVYTIVPTIAVKS